MPPVRWECVSSLMLCIKSAVNALRLSLLVLGETQSTYGNVHLYNVLLRPLHCDITLGEHVFFFSVLL